MGVLFGEFGLIIVFLVDEFNASDGHANLLDNLLLYR